MSDDNQDTGPSTTVKVLQGTATTLETIDHASVGLGAVERAVPGVTKAAAQVISKSAPIIGPAGGGTLKMLGNFGGKVAVPLQLIIGAGEVAWDIHKGDYRALGEDAGGTIGGIGGGIAVGAAVGSVVPVVGTAIGGIVGGIVGWWAGKKAGGAIAGHFVDKAEAEKKAKEDRATFDAGYHDMLATGAAGATVDFSKPKPQTETAPVVPVTAQPVADPVPVATTTVAETETTTTPVETTTATTDTRTAPAKGGPNSLGALLDNADNLHGDELKNVFNRVTQFAQDNHLKLGFQFSIASMASTFFNWFSYAGGAEWAEHWALHAMKDDLINQGPNLAGATDSRSHQPGFTTSSQPALALG